MFFKTYEPNPWLMLSEFCPGLGHISSRDFLRIYFIMNGMLLVFEGPVLRLEKDRDWTGPRPEKSRPDKTKTGKDRKKTGLYGPVFVVKTGLNR